MAIHWNQRVLAEIEQLTQSREVLDAELELGRAVAEVAKAAAPKDTGSGAESIHAELVRDPFIGIHAAVSWDKGEFLGLHELGTEKLPPNPFMRRAAAAVASANPGVTFLPMSGTG